MTVQNVATTTLVFVVLGIFNAFSSLFQHDGPSVWNRKISIVLLVVICSALLFTAEVRYVDLGQAWARNPATAVAVGFVLAYFAVLISVAGEVFMVVLNDYGKRLASSKFRRFPTIMGRSSLGVALELFILVFSALMALLVCYLIAVSILQVV